MTDTAERWRYIPGTDNKYAVSDLGRVWSYLRGGRLLRPGRMSGGHLSVALGRGNSRCVHELVLTAFVGPAPEGHEARHLDGDHKNNRLRNLEWSTYSRNIQDKKWHRLPANYKLTGAKASELKADLASGNFTTKALAVKYGVGKTTVYNIANGRVHVDA